MNYEISFQYTITQSIFSALPLKILNLKNNIMKTTKGKPTTTEEQKNTPKTTASKATAAKKATAKK